MEDFGVQPGDTVMIEGEIEFSKLKNMFEGEELDAQVKNRTTKGMMNIITEPYRTIAIESAKVICKDPNAPSPLDIYTNSKRIYDAKDGSRKFNIDSTSSCPPDFYHMVNGKAVRLEEMEGELAKGSKVKIILNVYRSKNPAHRYLGLGIRAILILDDPINYYQSASNNDKLIEGYGIQVEAPVSKPTSEAPEVATDTPQWGEPSEPNPFGGPSNENPFGSL